MRTRLCAVLAAALIFWAPCCAMAAQSVLTADEMDYDPATGEISASGAVTLTRQDGVISGDFGRGTADGRRFEINGSVTGSIRLDGSSEPVIITCGSLVMTTSGDERTIAAHDGACASRGEDYVRAETLSWQPGTGSYLASGSVDAHFGSHELAADEALRTGSEFKASGVRRYSDTKNRYTMSARTVEGKIGPDGISEVVADGAVDIEAIGADDEPVSISGSRAIYSTARGTLVISGGAAVVQHGRRLDAGSVVYWLEDGHVEALSRPSLVIQFDD